MHSDRNGPIFFLIIDVVGSLTCKRHRVLNGDLALPLHQHPLQLISDPCEVPSPQGHLRSLPSRIVCTSLKNFRRTMIDA